MKNKTWKIIGFVLTYIGMLTFGFLCGIGYLTYLIPEIMVPTKVYIGTFVGLFVGYVGMIIARLSVEGEIGK